MSKDAFSSHQFAKVSAVDWSDPRRPVKAAAAAAPPAPATEVQPVQAQPAPVPERAYVPQPFAEDAPPTAAERTADQTVRLANDGLSPDP